MIFLSNLINHSLNTILNLEIMIEQYKQLIDIKFKNIIIKLLKISIIIFKLKKYIKFLFIFESFIKLFFLKK